jgi:hypothetical protein
MKELDHSLSSLRKRSEVHWTELSELQAEIKTKANTAEVSRGFVRKEVFTEFMRSLGEEVDRKSTLVEMQRQEQDIQVILSFLPLFCPYEPVLVLPCPTLSGTVGNPPKSRHTCITT